MWRLDVRVGDLEVAYRSDAEEEAVPALPFLVDIRVTDELDDEAQGWPRPQGPSTAALTFLMDTAAEAAAAIPGGAEVAAALYVEEDLTNYAMNPGSEVDVTFTRRLGGATGAVTRDTTRDHSGVASARVVVTATGSLGTLYDMASAFSTPVAFPGDRVTGGVWVRPDTTSTWHPYVTGPRISTGVAAAYEPTPAQDVVCPAGVWTWVPVDVVLPPDHTASRAGVRHKGNAPAVGFGYNTDDALFLVNSPEEDVAAFHGGHFRLEDGRYSYSWEGTAHQSHSVRHVDPVATFYGRASDPVVKPHDRGVLVQVTCADYLADLGAETVGSADRPQENTDARLDSQDLEGELGLLYWSEATASEADPSYWSTLAARAGSATDLLSWAQEILASSVFMEAWRTTADFIWRWRPHVYELRPVVDPATGSLGVWNEDVLLTEFYALAELERTLYTEAMGTLVEEAGVWTLTFPDPVPGVIPAEVTDFDATWARRPTGDINTVDVVYNGGESVERVTSWTPGRARVTDRRETQLVTEADAQELGGVYLPAADDIPGSGWEAERFTVYLDLAPYGWWPGALRAVAVLAGVQERHNPDGRTWWAGGVAFREWRIADGQATVDVGLIAQPLESSGFTLLEIDTAPGTLDTLDPTLTINQLALARGPE